MTTTTRPATDRRPPGTRAAAAGDRERFVREATERLLRRDAGLMARLADA